MKWTDVRPSKPGHWWYRWNHGVPRVLHLLHAMGDDKLWASGDDGDLREIYDGPLSQWSDAPIAEPEEA